MLPAERLNASWLKMGDASPALAPLTGIHPPSRAALQSPTFLGNIIKYQIGRLFSFYTAVE
jgi:hypothetical protein